MNLPSTFIEHALACFPNEACGVLCAGEFVPCDNLSKTPTVSFEIDPAVIASRDDIDYIVHSHTVGFGTGSNVDPRTPSKQDMQGQIDTDLPWAIAYCDGTTVTEAVTFGDKVRPPLEGRECVINVSDCLTLTTDYYSEKHGITLPAIARSIDWNERGENLINDNLEAWGFHEVPMAEAKPSDLVLFKLPRSKVANHIGVFLGEDQVLHLLWGRLSCVDNLSTYVKHIDKVVRHKELS